MAGRRLSPEESALWARVAATVRALGVREATAADHASPVLPRRHEPGAASAAPADPGLPPAQEHIGARGKAPTPPTDTLDGGWDRRLRRGLVAPDRTIDLHGHNLASAHDALDRAIDRAIGDDVRLLLVVTGRPPRPDGEGRRRGLIRAAIGDWLATSRHAGRIAAVRNAHPRHGGAGALYLIFRRRRG